MVEPYIVSTLTIVLLWAKRVKVVNIICERVFPIFHVAHMRMRIKHCKHMASLYKHMGDITGGISLLSLKVWIKNPALSSLPPHVTLHAHIKIIISSGVAQSSNNYIILFIYLVCFFFYLVCNLTILTVSLYVWVTHYMWSPTNKNQMLETHIDFKINMVELKLTICSL